MKLRKDFRKPWIIRCRTGRKLRLRMSVDALHNLGSPIDRDHHLPGLKNHGRVLSDQQEMRQGLVQGASEHVSALQASYCGEEVLAYVGNSNLLANFNVVA